MTNTNSHNEVTAFRDKWMKINIEIIDEVLTTRKNKSALQRLQGEVSNMKSSLYYVESRYNATNNKYQDEEMRNTLSFLRDDIRAKEQELSYQLNRL
ncbi:MAG: hypothetical protein LBV67_09510 [Streptococcaceae bacterium]|jgi:hypothetical protein|nr:hypothetical protein [Streptococcaceae bacterium]